VIWLRRLLVAFLIVALFSCARLPRRETLTMPYADRIKLASIYIQNGQQDQAIPLLKDAARQEGDRPEAWAMLGELFWLKGNLAESSAYLEKALKVGKEDPVVLNNLAMVEAARDNPERALALVDRALARDPAPMYPYLETRARVLLKLGRYQKALEEAKLALSITPDYEKKMRDQLEGLITEIEKEKGELKIEN